MCEQDLISTSLSLIILCNFEGKSKAFQYSFPPFHSIIPSIDTRLDAWISIIGEKFNPLQLFFLLSELEVTYFPSILHLVSE